MPATVAKRATPEHPHHYPFLILPASPDKPDLTEPANYPHSVTHEMMIRRKSGCPGPPLPSLSRGIRNKLTTAEKDKGLGHFPAKPLVSVVSRTGFEPVTH